MDDKKMYFTQQEAAQFLEIPTNLLQIWRDEIPELKTTKIGHAVCFDVSKLESLEKILREHHDGIGKIPLKKYLKSLGFLRSKPRKSSLIDPEPDPVQEEIDLIGNPPTQIQGKMFLTPIEAAEYRGIAKNTLLNWRSSGKGPKFRRLSGMKRSKVVYSVKDIEQWCSGLPAVSSTKE
jgi:hypothetical protein